jgi:hypothetical protein
MFKSKKTPNLRSSTLATLLAALIGGISLIVTKIIPEHAVNSFEAIFEAPIAGQTIENEFAAVVRLNNVPKEDHIWVAVEIDNLLWFKQPEINKSDHKVVINLVENNLSQKGHFSLSLVKVSSTGQRVITDWILKGKSTGKYPGINISEIPEASRIDVVQGLKINQ